MNNGEDCVSFKMIKVEYQLFKAFSTFWLFCCVSLFQIVFPPWNSMHIYQPFHSQFTNQDITGEPKIESELRFFLRVVISIKGPPVDPPQWMPLRLPDGRIQVIQKPECCKTQFTDMIVFIEEEWRESIIHILQFNVLLSSLFIELEFPSFLLLSPNSGANL